MRAWLRPIAHRLIMGLVPLDGDFGKRPAPAADESDRCPRIEPAPLRPRPPREEAAWIPNTILFGPPL
jgi:hypothetical protein